MSSSTEYRDFILERLSCLENIVCKPMMGEFLLYCDGILFGGIYDNRFLIKMTSTNESYSLDKEIPYTGAKPMYMVDELDDEEYLTKIIKETIKGLNKK